MQQLQSLYLGSFSTVIQGGSPCYKAAKGEREKGGGGGSEVSYLGEVFKQI